MEQAELDRIKELADETHEQWVKIHIKNGSGDREKEWFVTGSTGIQGTFQSRADACKWASAFLLIYSLKIESKELQEEEFDIEPTDQRADEADYSYIIRRTCELYDEAYAKEQAVPGGDYQLTSVVVHPDFSPRTPETIYPVENQTQPCIKVIRGTNVAVGEVLGLYSGTTTSG